MDLPVDDRQVLDVVDRVAAQQAARHQLVEHRTHLIVVERVAGEYLQTQGARPQRLHAEIIGEIAQAEQ